MKIAESVEGSIDGSAFYSRTAVFTRSDEGYFEGKNENVDSMSQHSNSKKSTHPTASEQSQRQQFCKGPFSMTVLLNIALMNALSVLPLAGLAIFVSRMARRPALTHAVWVLVLLKFLTPPLFQSPVSIEVPSDVLATNVSHVSSASASASPLSSHSTNDTDIPKIAAHVTPAPASSSSAPPRVIAATVTSSAPPIRRDAPSALTVPSPTVFASLAQRLDVRSMLLVVWLTGVAVWTALQLVRAVRFQRRVIRDALPNDEFQLQTEQLAVAMGLRRGPQVLIVEATVSPMLWGCGSRAKLLFPSDLAKRLDVEARATLLAHELAHFVRGDHWVRLLELIATTLFWWHPVVWWARRQIEEAEEECCDAWVVSQFPHAPRQYAEALLDTIDYLCERRQPLPPVACGLGQAHFIRHRLKKIMHGATPKVLSQQARYATLLVAALLLPMQPFVFGSASVSNLRGPARLSPTVVEASSFPSLNEHAVTSENAGDSAASIPAFPEASASNETLSPTSSSRIRPLRGEKVWSTAASPDGRFVVRATTARRVVLTDLQSNTETDLSHERITAVAFAPDGDWFAAVDQEGRVSIWDSSRAELLRTVQTHTEALRTVAVSPNGRAIATGGRDGSVLLIDADTGASLADLPNYSSAVNCVRFSADGRQLAVAVGDWNSNRRGEVTLVNTATGRTDATLPCVTSPGVLTFASNEELIVGLWDGRTQLWNLVHRQVVATALADKSVVSAAAFSPDNPALREAIFIAESLSPAEPTAVEESSPLSILRSLFTVPAN